jgi:hypothetical protein
MGAFEGILIEAVLSRKSTEEYQEEGSSRASAAPKKALAR